MNFADSLLSLIERFARLVVDLFQKFAEFMAAPLAYLLAFLEGIFYFITVLFKIVVNIVMLFVALFQFFFACVAGLFRTLGDWLGFNLANSTDLSFPSVSNSGFGAVMKAVEPTGVLTIVPLIGIFMVWLGFLFKVFKLFGGEVYYTGSPKGDD